jgi:hypothetical protein
MKETIEKVTENGVKKEATTKEINLTDKQLEALNKTNGAIGFHEAELKRAQEQQSQLLELILEFNDIVDPKSVEMKDKNLKVTV